MKKYMTLAERDEILKKFQDYCKANSMEGFHMSYAFGWLSAMLTDEQLKEIEKVVKRNG